MAVSTPLKLLLDGLVEVRGKGPFLSVVDDPDVEHRRGRDAGRADRAGPERSLEAELEAKGGEADALVLVPLRQWPARVRAPLPRARHLVHGADQLQPVFRLGVNERLRVVGVEDDLRVRRVLEVAERLGTRRRSPLEPRGDRRRRVPLAGQARPSMTQQAGGALTLPGGSPRAGPVKQG